MPIEHIRLSEQAKDQLIKLKRMTGIQHWNVLCRWAFCTSLAESSPPLQQRIPADSSVEMTWKVFAGKNGDIYWQLLLERCRRDGVNPNDEVCAQQFRAHLHRGIAHLSADRRLRSVAQLISAAAPLAIVRTDRALDQGSKNAPSSNTQ